MGSVAPAIRLSRLVEELQEGNGDLTDGAKNGLLQEGFCCIWVVAFNTTLSALDYVLISKLEVNQFKLKTEDCQPPSGDLDLCVSVHEDNFQWIMERSHIRIH